MSEDKFDMKDIRVPAHLAVIMDGNGRWARKRNLPRSLGHREGAEALRRIVRLCPVYGVRYLSVFAFSTENWKRPESEVQSLMALLGEFIVKELDTLIKEGVCFRFIGDLSPLAPELRYKIEDARTRTEGLDKLILTVALNYSGRQDLLRAAKALARRALAGEDPDKWTDNDLSAELYTGSMPDPDLLIRTGSEKRVSNFMLWQIAYTELWYTDTLWPDFNEDVLREALGAYSERQRRFGGV